MTDGVASLMVRENDVGKCIMKSTSSLLGCKIDKSLTVAQASRLIPRISRMLPLRLKGLNCLRVQGRRVWELLRGDVDYLLYCYGTICVFLLDVSIRLPQNKHPVILELFFCIS